MVSSKVTQLDQSTNELKGCVLYHALLCGGHKQSYCTNMYAKHDLSFRMSWKKQYEFT